MAGTQLRLWPCADVEEVRAFACERHGVGESSVLDDGRASLSAADPQQSHGQQLANRMGKRIHLTFTNNRSTMLSCQEVSGTLRVRLHRLFLDAPDVVWLALASFLADDEDSGDAGRVLDTFLAKAASAVPRRPIRLRPIGRYHNLQALFARLNSSYFSERNSADITWGNDRGTVGQRRSRRSIQLGSYVHADNVIRIHPCLDQGFVPEFYVQWIVYHEMLHEIYGADRGRHGRQLVHPPAFRALEASYPDYDRCQAWQQAHIDRLVRYRGGAARK